MSLFMGLGSEVTDNKQLIRQTIYRNNSNLIFETATGPENLFVPYHRHGLSLSSLVACNGSVFISAQPIPLIVQIRRQHREAVKTHPPIYEAVIHDLQRQNIVVRPRQVGNRWDMVNLETVRECDFNNYHLFSRRNFFRRGRYLFRYFASSFSSVPRRTSASMFFPPVRRVASTR